MNMVTATSNAKYNMLASLHKWLMTNVASISWDFTNVGQASTLPKHVDVSEFSDVDPGADSFADFKFPAGAGLNKRGQENQARLAFDIYSVQQDSTNADAEKSLYQMRDTILTALKHAGVVSAAGVFTFASLVLLQPAIELKDYAFSSTSPTDTQTVIEFRNGPNDVLERYYPPTSERPGQHQLQLLIRFYWQELTY